jgi:hypothetical protein
MRGQVEGALSTQLLYYRLIISGSAVGPSSKSCHKEYSFNDMLKSHGLARQHAVLEFTYSEHSVHALGMPSDYRRMRNIYTALLHKDAPESHQTGKARLLYQPPVPHLRLSLEIAVSACQRIVSDNVLLQPDRTPRPRG